MPIKDAATLLFFRSQQEVLAYAQQVRLHPGRHRKRATDTQKQRGWQVDLTGGTITFAKKGEEKLEIPKDKLITANLQYARELEMIV